MTAPPEVTSLPYPHAFPFGRRWRYKQPPPPKQLPRPPLSVWIASAVLLAGIIAWFAGFQWGVLPVILGLAGLLLAGIRDRKSTRLNSSPRQYLVCRLLLEKK